jgi:hypothetical protein
MVIAGCSPKPGAEPEQILQVLFLAEVYRLDFQVRFHLFLFRPNTFRKAARRARWARLLASMTARVF